MASTFRLLRLPGETRKMAEKTKRAAGPHMVRLGSNLGDALASVTERSSQIPIGRHRTPG